MFQIAPIGQQSAERINDLATLIGSLALKEDETAEISRLLATAVEILEQSTSTISVVGQVKSGKSSLINALSGLGDFLPTEVNPWTAVITNLHFGHIDKPDSGAVFQMFSDQEWLQMIEGDPESRKLAEELLPGFRSDVLERQVHEMQDNARKRLGELYHLLLGKKHRFNDVTPEILERYVSAGYADGGQESSAGRFSGITKSADVFLPAGPFHVPVTLSDTPGINDPFLVRDALTTSSFKYADAFISTISVHQPLGPADIALLKMLATHSGKTTIIFVNRIDELDAPDRVADELIPALERRLQEEMGTSNYVLLAGSAHWGRIAAIGSDQQVAEALASRAFRALAAAKRIDATRYDPRGLLYAVSGMPELSHWVSGLIRDRKMATALARATTEIQAALDLLTIVLRERIERDRRMLVDTSQIDNLLEAERERIGARHARVAEAIAALSAILDDAQTEILKNGDVVFTSIRNAIDAAVGSFVTAQSNTLREALAGNEETSSWEVDIEPFCRRVEDQVAKAYQHGRAQVDRSLSRHAREMSDRIEPLVGELPMSDLLRNLPHDDIFPSFKPRTFLVEMELKVSRGWQFWRSRKMNQDEAAQRLEQMIWAEVRSSEEELRTTAIDAIAARNSEAMARLQAHLGSASDMLGAEAKLLKAEIDRLNRSDAREHISQLHEERQSRSDRLERRLAEIEAAKTELLDRFGDVLSHADTGPDSSAGADRAIFTAQAENGI